MHNGDNFLLKIDILKLAKIKKNQESVWAVGDITTVSNNYNAQ